MALELPKIDICQNWPRRVLGEVISCLESKFDKKIPMGSVPNCRKEIPNRYGIRWFKCKLKPPKKGITSWWNSNTGKQWYHWTMIYRQVLNIFHFKLISQQCRGACVVGRGLGPSCLVEWLHFPHICIFTWRVNFVKNFENADNSAVTPHPHRVATFEPRWNSLCFPWVFPVLRIFFPVFFSIKLIDGFE